MIRLLFLALIPCFFAGYVAADGNQLLEQCQSAQRLIDGVPTSNIVDAGECIGTLQGTVDTLEISRHTFSNDKTKPLPPLICWPSQAVVPRAQSIRIVVQYLQQHPGDLHMNGSTLAILALADAFPCNNSG
jgi:hypothetical protein